MPVNRRLRHKSFRKERKPMRWDSTESYLAFSTRIAQVTSALSKPKPVRRNNNISLGIKVNLMPSLAISIFLYATEL